MNYACRHGVHFKRRCADCERTPMPPLVQKVATIANGIPVFAGASVPGKNEALLEAECARMMRL